LLSLLRLGRVPFYQDYDESPAVVNYDGIHVLMGTSSDGGRYSITLPKDTLITSLFLIVFNKSRLGDHFFLFNDAGSWFYRDDRDNMNPPSTAGGNEAPLKFKYLSPVPTLTGRYATQFQGAATYILVKLCYGFVILFVIIIFIIMIFFSLVCQQ